MSTPVQPIYVIKKKGGHGGHHGGAWKVAYADFVTAMMALFMVMWLMNATPEVKKAVSGYFKDAHSSGSKTGSNVGGGSDGITLSKSTMKDLKEKLQQAIQKRPEFQKMKDNVEMTITGEGLRIELLETEKGMFFSSGAPIPTPVAKDLLVQLAGELGKLKNPLMIEGHTDSTPYGTPDYTNWELSTDRANAARRVMQGAGLDVARVTQVRGFADQRLRVTAHPDDASNRRVSIIVGYAADERPEEPEGKGGKGKEAGEHEGGASPKAKEGHEGGKAEVKTAAGEGKAKEAPAKEEKK